MTLVVARTTSTQLHFFADTRLSNRLGQRWNPFTDHALKVVSIGARRVLAFAGSADPALDGIRELARIAGNLSKESILDRLLELQERVRAYADNADVSFILGEVYSSPALYRVAHGRVDFSASGTWIGDQQAYNAFMDLFLNPSKDRDWPEFDSDISRRDRVELAKSNRALEKVIELASVGTVGGYPIHAVIGMRTGVLEYCWTFYSKDPCGNIGPGEQSLMRTCGREGGAYNCSVLVPRTPGPSVVGIHLYERDVGILLSPLERNEPFIYRGTSAEFRNSVLSEHGCELTGIERNPSDCTILAGAL